MAKDKERLDVLLVNRGLAPSREKAKTLRVEFYSRDGRTAGVSAASPDA